MTYGTIKVDTVTFTNAGVDKSVTLSGLVQNPVFSGNVTVTGTLSGVTVTGTTANFTSGNFTNISGGTHTITSGVFAAGSAASPSITFTGDLNTGIYSPGADQVAISTGGSGRLFIDSSGRVGVGIASSDAATILNVEKNAVGITRLKITNTSTGAGSYGDLYITAGDTLTQLYNDALGNNGIQGATLWTASNHALRLGTNSTERLRITSAGLVGVGTSSPSGLLTLAWNSSAGINAGLIGQVNNSAGANNGYRIGLRTSSDATNWCSIDQAFDNLGGSAGTYIAFTTTSGYTPAERMRLTGTGLGVGTTSPGYALHVSGTGAVSSRTFATDATGDASFFVQNDGNGICGPLVYGSTKTAYGALASNETAFYSNRSTTIMADGGSTVIKFATGGNTERLRIDSSGRVGIGTSAPQSQLQVLDQIRVSNSTQAQGSLVLGDGGSTAFNVGIARWNGGTNAAGAGGIGYFSQGTGNIGGHYFYTGDAAAGSQTARMVILPGGNVGIGTTAPSYALHVVSASTSSVKFGASSAIDTQALIGNSAGDLIIRTTSSGDSIIASDVGKYLAFATNGVSEKARIDTSGRLLVGTSSVGGYRVSSTSYNPQAEIKGSFSSPSWGGSLAIVSTNQAGNLWLVNDTTNPASGDNLGVISFNGYDGTNRNQGASIAAQVDAATGTGDLPSRLVFSTTADGASSPTERMRIFSGGGFSVYSSTTGNDTIDSCNNQGAGTTYSTFIGRHSATGTTSGTVSVRIYTNGNIQNTNGSYTTLSDAKLKENIVDAGSQWDDLKAIQIRNWNFKAETGHETHRQIGPIAQELETVCPGLVFETPDRDAEGNETGEVTKGVNQSVLYMKAVKALQEAMERIETLEAKVAALESA